VVYGGRLLAGDQEWQSGRLLVVTLVLLSTVVAPGVVVPAHMEAGMARPGHPGWKAAEGSGCLVWSKEAHAAEKVTWSGPCDGNRATGQGELVWQTARYVGEMRDGMRHGRGTMTWADGIRYEGDFLTDNFHGRGTMVWPSGGRYEGLGQR
jgi:hypothetical protein